MIHRKLISALTIGAAGLAVAMLFTGYKLGEAEGLRQVAESPAQTRLAIFADISASVPNTVPPRRVQLEYNVAPERLATMPLLDGSGKQLAEVVE